MSTDTVQQTRVQDLNGRDVKKGAYVLYWMQQSQRADYNHALEYAVQQANALGQGVLVGFGLMDDYPDANLRHYTFMLEGLQETQAALARKGIKMVIQRGAPADVALALGRKASLIVCDRGYLRYQKAWRRQVSHSADCRVVQVESDVVVPIEVVSQKAEYAARTIRPKIHKHLNDYLVSFSSGAVKKSSLGLRVKGLILDDVEAALAELSIDRSILPVSHFLKGGACEGRKKLAAFIKNRFHRYVPNGNQPQTDDISHMSPYLHFGQLSPLYIAMKILASGRRLNTAQEAYIEELVVRRELAANFAHFTPTYDSYACLPQWVQKTLKEHQSDRRESIYTRRQLEEAATHDPYWNAAMREMKATGFMHNYMRMYWGKKILEWSRTPAYAYRTALAINNKYFLDGRDPNSYAGVAWVFGLHDRAWPERPIFGKIRYMAASGLERKCDIGAYVSKVDQLTRALERKAKRLNVSRAVLTDH